MKQIKIFFGLIIPDIGGILFNVLPMIFCLSVTDFYKGETQYPSAFIAIIFLLLIGLLLIPFRLLITFTRLFRINLNEYGAFSVAIIGGLNAGTMFYLLIPSHFSVNWINLTDYALLGVIQSTIAQMIFSFIPEEWKLKLEE